MDLGLHNRVAFVAGGTGGLGLAIGQALASEGASVALGGRRVELAQAEASKFERGYGVELDIVSQESVTRAIEETQATLGPIDIVVLNGGGPSAVTALNLNIDDARSDAELLLFGPIKLASLCVSGMQARGWGRFIAIGSSAIHQPIPGLTTSSMFRAALASYLKLLAEEIASDGITVNMVLPGRIATDRLAQLDSSRAERSGRSTAEITQESKQSIPVGRYGKVEEFAAAAAFLCSDKAAYITGEQLRIDGGMLRSL